MRKNDTAIALTEEQKQLLMEQIHDFFDAEFDEDIGIIKQSRILDLFIEQLAPFVYNKALDDAMLWYKRQQDNLESDFYSLYKDAR